MAALGGRPITVSILVPGARADLVVLTDDLEVVATFVAGRLAAHPRPDLLTIPSALEHA